MGKDPIGLNGLGFGEGKGWKILGIIGFPKGTRISRVWGWNKGEKSEFGPLFQCCEQ